MPMSAQQRARISVFTVDVMLVSSILAVTALHYFTSPQAAQFHDIYRRLYYIPIILAAFVHGSRGGIGAALFVTLLYLPHAFMTQHGGMHHDPATDPQKVLEIVLYNVVGLVAGLLVDRERAEKEMHRLTAQQLSGALSDMARLEAELIRKERMLLLGQMASGLAHEIRNPLGSIKGAAEILASGMAPDDRRREFADVLVKETGRLDRFLASFLEYAGPRPYRMAPADLDALARECAALLRAEAEPEGVSIVVEPPAAGARAVDADADRLRQVFVNIMRNAVQAMKGGGTLTVLTAVADGGARVEFCDTGPGIPADARKAIFEPFVSARQGGTGLGLAIARRIVEDHGGRIEADGAPAGGARLTVTLPAGGATTRATTPGGTTG